MYANRQKEKVRDTETEVDREERFTYEKLAHCLMEAEIFHKARETRKLLVSFGLSSKSWQSDASVTYLLIQSCFPQCWLALITVINSLFRGVTRMFLDGRFSASSPVCPVFFLSELYLSDISSSYFFALLIYDTQIFKTL